MNNSKKLICIVSPCYNERENVRLLYDAVQSEMANLPDVGYEFLFIDNASSDGTEYELRKLAEEEQVHSITAGVGLQKP